MVIQQRNAFHKSIALNTNNCFENIQKITSLQTETPGNEQPIALQMVMQRPATLTTVNREILYIMPMQS
uniref:Uncharacterized protein n=1 Tax=Romanomermis culicivorax TaxID=13658 RepID=A0A915JQ33_ROMCU